MNSTPKCPICKGTNFDITLTCKDHSVSSEVFSIRECTTCQLNITWPLPTTLDKYYLSDAYISHSAKASSLIDKLYLLARRYTVEWKWRLVTNSSKSPATILDYGCGTGEFLKKCKEKGLTVNGVEPSESARAQASQNTQTQIAKNIDQIAEHKFDIITLWHVLEHVQDINLTLSLLKQKLADSGTMFIAVPNHNSYDAQHYSSNWAGYDVPRHLWHFSQSSIEQLIINQGMTLTAKFPMKLDAFYISLVSEKYRGNGHISLLGYLKATLTAILSNMKAAHSTEYSSIIYVVKK